MRAGTQGVGGWRDRKASIYNQSSVGAATWIERQPMDIDLDMSVLGLDDHQQEVLKHRQVTMTCPNGHAVAVRLMRGSGSSTITCPQCNEQIEPQLPESASA